MVLAMNRNTVLCKITTKMSVKMNAHMYTHTHTHAPPPHTHFGISRQRSLLTNRSISIYNLITKLALIVYVNCCSPSIYHYASVFFLRSNTSLYIARLRLTLAPLFVDVNCGSQV